MNENVQEKCPHHDEVVNIVNSTSKWMSAEEVHRANLYKVLTDLQTSNANLIDKLNSIEVNIHKEFATKSELDELRKKVDKHLWKVLGITFAGGATIVGFVQWIILYARG